jgi:hypothetical protein
VRTLVEDALEPLQRTLAEAQQRVGYLERLAAQLAARAAAAPAHVPATVVLSATPAPGPAAPAPYASAMAAPAAAASIAPNVSRSPSIIYSMPPAPLLDVEAINREIPLSLDMRAFDGRRRRRRNVILFVVGLLVIFGALFGLLADSYTPHP